MTGEGTDRAAAAGHAVADSVTLRCLVAAGVDVEAAREAVEAFLAAPPDRSGPDARPAAERPAQDGPGAAVIPLRPRRRPAGEAS